ncbi:helix-turn-helix transcriptional regulator [Parabacteroides sp.]
MKPIFALDRYFEQFASIAIGSFYVLDVQQKKICYVKSDDLFLCGFSINDVLRLGYDFYSKVIFAEDLPLWMNMYRLTLQYLNRKEEDREISCFSCTFRLQRTYTFNSHPILQMVYHRGIPVWVDNELRYMLCCVDSSTCKESGHLCLHYKDGLIFSEYNFITKRWMQKEKEVLTERERVLLMFGQQGKSAIEMSDLLCKGYDTIRNQIKALFLKLKTHSMQESIEMVNHFHMLYSKLKEL